MIKIIIAVHQPQTISHGLAGCFTDNIFNPNNNLIWEAFYYSGLTIKELRLERLKNFLKVSGWGRVDEVQISDISQLPLCFLSRHHARNLLNISELFVKLMRKQMCGFA